MRGLAILFVLADHFDVPGFDFGFIGVDIFFVVSGYLIVSLMYQEYATNGKSLGGYGWISISSFFHRRVRRILPAAMFVLALTYIATIFFIDASARVQVKRDILWALLFASNINFAQSKTDYFSNIEIPSPVLHYWSLAVEEQFYILMPFFFMAVVNWHGFSIRGRRFAAKSRLIIAIVSVSAISFSAMVLTRNSPNPENFYSVFPRIWEFGLGGLAGLITPKTNFRSRIISLLVRRSSIFILLVSLLFINEKNYNYILIIPLLCLATIIFINAQFKFGFFYKRILTNTFLTFFGQISFSLYLWHWPVLVFSSYLFGEVSIIAKAFMLVFIIALSTATERFIERPFLKSGLISEFHTSPVLKDRRIMTGICVALASSLFIFTYQPFISTYLTEIRNQREAPFWTPPLSEKEMINKLESDSIAAPTKPVEQILETPNFGIFGDSTNQCCSATGAFWPRLTAKHFGWNVADYSRPAVSYFSDGVGSNGCTDSKSCPSVEAQLLQASGKSFDFISVSSGIPDCKVVDENPRYIQQRIDTLFNKLASKYPDANIFVLGVIQSKESRGDKCLAAVNSIILQATQSAGISFIDVSGWITDTKSQMTRDRAHLNDVGHLLFANKVIEELKRA